jgi:hypothetical protein
MFRSQVHISIHGASGPCVYALLCIGVGYVEQIDLKMHGMDNFKTKGDIHYSRYSQAAEPTRYARSYNGHITKVSGRVLVFLYCICQLLLNVM